MIFAVVEVGIVLAFFFLIMSAAASYIWERFAGLFSLRHWNLKRTLVHLLASDDNSLYRNFRAHPLYKSLSANGKPSYLPPDLFSTILVDILRASDENRRTRPVEDGLDELAPGLGRESLHAQWRASNQRVHTFGDMVEAWYANAMDRASGVYKRVTQLGLFFIGIGFAISSNADVVAVANKAYFNAQFRDAIYAEAKDLVRKNRSTSAAIDDAGKGVMTLRELDMPIGWRRQ